MGDFFLNSCPVFTFQFFCNIMIGIHTHTHTNTAVLWKLQILVEIQKKSESKINPLQRLQLPATVVQEKDILQIKSLISSQY